MIISSPERVENFIKEAKLDLELALRKCARNHLIRPQIILLKRLGRH